MKSQKLLPAIQKLKFSKQYEYQFLENYNFDEGAILTALISIAVKGGQKNLTSNESIILAALRRSAKKFEDASVEEIGEILDSYDDFLIISGSISQIITFAPEFKNLFAISKPKPCAPPVITAVLLLKLKDILSIELFFC